MLSITNTQLHGQSVFARASRRPVCSNVWTTDTAITTPDAGNVIFAEMVKPANKHLGYGAGNTIPTKRPRVPM